MSPSKTRVRHKRVVHGRWSRCSGPVIVHCSIVVGLPPQKAAGEKGYVRREMVGPEDNHQAHPSRRHGIQMGTQRFLGGLPLA
jgi:hypothetical protein